MTNPAPVQSRPLTPLERRQRNRLEMIDNILTAARSVMREYGVAALNLQEVARRIGTRAPSLYEYFENKHALYDALFRLGFQRYGEHIADLFTRQYPTVWDLVRAAMERQLSFALESPELYQLCFERPVPGFVPSDESLGESLRLLANGREAFRAVVEANELRLGLPPEQAFDLLIAIAHGITAQHLANEPHLPLGAGRFGGLIPATVEILRAAWGPPAADA
jgi:AcrR family transcriptional regulator